MNSQTLQKTGNDYSKDDKEMTKTMRMTKKRKIQNFPEIGKVKDNDDDKDDYNAKDLFKDKKWLQTFSNCRFPR